MSRWSKLQRDLYRLIEPRLDFQLHCRVVRMQSQRGRTNLPRYWITVGGEVVWDYPGRFVHRPTRFAGGPTGYPHTTDISAISMLIRDYINTPLPTLLRHAFEQDCWGLVNLLRAADRRLGRGRLLALKRKTHNRAARLIIERRLEILDHTEAP
jgi:hypothetical protein